MTPTNTKISVTWLEVILVALLLIGGMGAWKLAERWVNYSLRADAPKLDQYEQKHQVLDLKVDLVAAEEQLKVLQQQEAQERLTAIKVEAQVESLKKQYPVLTTLPITDTATVPGETLKAYVQASGDARATELLIASLESSFTELITGTLTLSTTLTGQQDPNQQAETRIKLALFQKQLATTSNELVEARLKLAKQQATVASTIAAYPELQNPSQGVVPNLSVQTPIAEAYIAATSTLTQTNRTLEALADSLSIARNNMIAQTDKLTDAQLAAAAELEGAAEHFHWRKQGNILWRTVIGVSFLFLLTFVCTRSISSLKQIQLNLGTVLGISALALLMLYAFQASEVGGAATVGALVVIIVLGVALGRIPSIVRARKG